MTEMEKIFGAGGLLKRHLPRYEYRPSQLQMAEAVGQAIQQKATLLVEAGTGTGKTLAYLSPAILSRKRMVVSTGTKTLQHQLQSKDIPFLKQYLGVNFTSCVMKGRENYLCRRRFEEFLHQPLFRLSHETKHFNLIQEWAAQTKTGDREELSDLPDNFQLWSEICSRTSTCKGQKCRYFTGCFLTLLKQQAAKADIIIVNHHLLFADLLVKEVAENGVLPGYSGLIFDEAHQLEDIATRYFGVSVNSYQVEELAKDVRWELSEIGHKDASLHKLLDEISVLADIFFSQFRRDESRYRLRPQHITPPVNSAHSALAGKLESVYTRLAAIPEEGLEGCIRLAENIHHGLELVLKQAEPDQVYWVEQRGNGVFLQASPINVAGHMQERLYSKLTCLVLTSATLTTQGNFNFIKSRLGIRDSRELVLPSGFDFPRQTLIYLPKHLPPPTTPQFAEAASGEIQRILTITKGRALVLFTSYQNLEQTYRYLQGKIPYQLLKQGDKAKAALLAGFQQDIHSVLLATSSFWEGIDVPGEALSCIIIDRLPFKVPTEPLVQARIEHLNQQGGNAFLEYQVPEALVAFRQGFGRLIRHRQDRGLFSVLDNRVTSRSYGRLFLSALPSCPCVYSLDRVEKFNL